MSKAKGEGERVQEHRVLEDEEKKTLEVVEDLDEKIPAEAGTRHLDQDLSSAGQSTLIGRQDGGALRSPIRLETS